MTKKTQKSFTHQGVPRYSQFLDIRDKKWKAHSCGIVSLKMMLDYWKTIGIKPVSSPTRSGIQRQKNWIPAFAGMTTLQHGLGKLLKEGLTKDNDWFVLKTGWRHKTIAALARKHGLWGKNYDWIKNTPERAFKKLIPYFRKYPVIASIYKNFKPGSSGHLVVLTGIDKDMIFYNDPIAKRQNNIVRIVPIAQFLVGWKKRIIVIKPTSLKAQQR